MVEMGRNSPSTRPKLHPEITHRIPKFTSEALKSMDELEIIFEAALTRDENSDTAAIELSHIELCWLFL